MDTLLQRLHGLDSTARHQDLAALHLHGTGTWLYDTAQYMTWRNGSQSLLWLQGKGGFEHI